MSGGTLPNGPSVGGGGYGGGGGGGGDVSGPGASVVDNIVTWNNVNGTLVKDSGVAITAITAAMTQPQVLARISLGF